MTGEALIQHLKTLIAKRERRGVELKNGRFAGLALGYTPAADGEVQRLMLSRVGFHPDDDDEKAVRWALAMALSRLGRGVIDGPHLEQWVKLPQHPKRGCSLITWREASSGRYWQMAPDEQRQLRRFYEETNETNQFNGT